MAFVVPRPFLCLTALIMLCGCRLDVTQTIDVASKGRELVTYRETFDDEAFSVTTQLGGPSAFAFDAAKQDGWGVRASSGPNEHTFIFERAFSVEDAQAQLARPAHDSAAAAPNDAFLLGPTAFIGMPITSSTSNEQSASIPALLRPSETLIKGGGADPAFKLANARVNAADVDSVVRVHVELRDETGLRHIDPSFGEATAISPSSKIRLHVGPLWPLSRILAFWRYVGPYGVFDYERHSPPLCSSDPKYHKAWMFGVGVYVNGAHIPEQLMGAAGTLAQNWLARHPVKCP